MSGGVDLRTAATIVKDQGRRGTCVSCAATVAHELVRCEGIDLSVEFLHWASKRRDNLPPNSEGTTLAAARAALDQLGQPPEVTWPYDDARNQWAADYQPTPDAIAGARLRRISGGEILQPTADSIRSALEKNRPVVLGVRLYATWYTTGADGHVPLPATGSRDFGGHAVLVVGYRNSDFIVQNSWGSDWGDGGFAYLPDMYVDRFGIAAWSFAV